MNTTTNGTDGVGAVPQNGVNAYDMAGDVPTFGETRRLILTYNPTAEKDVEIIGPDGRIDNLMRGGFGADVSSGVFPFGPIAEVPHGGRTATEYVSRWLRGVAVLGWESFWVCMRENEDAENGRAYRIARHHRPNVAGWGSRSRMMYYIAFLDDPALQIHALMASGTATQRGNEQIAATMPGLAARAAGMVGARRLGVCALRVNIGVRKPITVGRDAMTSVITPPMVDLGNASFNDTDFRNRILPADLYARLLALSQQVKDETEESERAAKPFHEILKIEQDMRQQLPALGPAAPEAPPNWDDEGI